MSPVITPEMVSLLKRTPRLDWESWPNSLMTTSITVVPLIPPNPFKAGRKLCPGSNHNRTHIQGEETARSAYYPWKMVQAFTRHWRDQEVPVRHLRVLESAYNVADHSPDDGETMVLENDDLQFEGGSCVQWGETAP